MKFLSRADNKTGMDQNKNTIQQNIYERVNKLIYAKEEKINNSKILVL